MIIPEPTATIRLTGPDSERFLSGQITQDVSNLKEGEIRYTFICDVKGRIEFHANITRSGETILITTESLGMEALSQRLDKYLIADQCELEPTPNHQPQAPSDEEEHARLLAGIPSQKDLAGLFPAESGLLEQGVSFTKGCYQGQEIISRMKRAGKTNARLVSCQLNGTPSALPFEFCQESHPQAKFTVTSASENTQSEKLFPAMGILLRKAEPEQPFPSQEGISISKLREIQ